MEPVRKIVLSGCPRHPTRVLLTRLVKAGKTGRNALLLLLGLLLLRWVLRVLSILLMEEVAFALWRIAASLYFLLHHLRRGHAAVERIKTIALDKVREIHGQYRRIPVTLTTLYTVYVALGSRGFSPL